jgi:hypothetical protein
MRKGRLVIAVIVVVFVIAFVSFTVFQGKQDPYTQAATAAARKVTPHAKAKDVKVAGGFAIATVSDPSAKGQVRAGNVTVFKVNKDGSMTQIAAGSVFTPLDLLELGMPLETQAKLTGNSIGQVKQNLANQFDYSPGSVLPGYTGFDGSFNPGGWQIDASTLDGLEQALTAVISSKNTDTKYNESIICVSATRENSNATTDTQTYISTFTLELQFISANGKITDHTFTFATGPGYYRSYTLDGQKI